MIRSARKPINEKCIAGLLLCSMLFATVAVGQTPDSGTGGKTADTANAISIRTIDARSIQEARRDKQYEYANDPAYWKLEKPEPQESADWAKALARFLGKRGVREFIYALFIFGIGFAVIRVWQDNGFNLFGGRRRKKKLAGELAEYIIVDYDEEIRQAVASANWTAAVRYMYLKLLSLLEHQDAATAAAFFTTHPKQTEFRFLRRAFEYVFYGGFAVSKEQFSQLEPRFRDAYQTVNS